MPKTRPVPTNSSRDRALTARLPVGEGLYGPPDGAPQACSPTDGFRRSTMGFERRHNAALQLDSEDEFVTALTRDVPPAPEGQDAIVAANRSGRPTVETG